jgi:DNA repair exonuclease SbcCD ATPase subunit
MIERVTAKNFQSWKNLEFTVQKGNTLITGFNYDDNTAEGVGKSAILNAICWGIFGTIPKDSNIDDVITQGEKSCSVNVYLKNGISIVRTRKPNDLYFFSSDSPETIIRGKDIKDTQKLIENRIKFTYETFLQSVYFAQNSLVKFLLSNEEGKVKILSQIADLHVFDIARKKANQLLKEAFLKLSEKKSKLNAVVQSIQTSVDQIESLKRMKTKFESEKIKILENLQIKSDQLEVSIKQLGIIPELGQEYYIKITDLKDTLEEFKEKIIFYRSELSKQAEKIMRKKILETELKALNTEIEGLKTDKNSQHCNSCGSELKDKEKQKYIATIASEIDKRNKEIKDMNFVSNAEIQENYEMYFTRHKELEKDIKYIEKLELEIVHKKEKKSILTNQLNYIKQEIEDNKNKQFPDIEKRIELLQNSLNEKKKEQKELESDLESNLKDHSMYETIKEGFTEVKSLSFQEILSELNSRSNYYLSELFDNDIKIKFSNIDTDGEVSKIETFLEINSEDRKLGLFSGGQTRRIMLAVDLAISDIIHSRKGIKDKLLILDEYFKDLSEQSISKIVTLLSNLETDVIMIEHNSLLRGLATNVVDVGYTNSESYMLKG